MVKASTGALLVTQINMELEPFENYELYFHQELRTVNYNYYLRLLHRTIGELTLKAIKIQIQGPEGSKNEPLVYIEPVDNDLLANQVAITDLKNFQRPTFFEQEKAAEL